MMKSSAEVIGSVSLREIENIRSVISNEFNDKWVRRKSDLMSMSNVLKARTPTNIDTLKTDESSRLFSVLRTVIDPLLLSGESIVYADVSCLPAISHTRLHIDYMWIHLLSRRITIPLTTNSGSLMSMVMKGDSVYVHHLKVGGAYLINNLVPHRTVNYGTTDRWHIIADVIKDTDLDFLVRTGRVMEPALPVDVHKTLNPMLSIDCENMMRKYCEANSY